jgi:hypothetical protein
MDFKIFGGDLTNELLLTLLPFGTGYLLDEEGIDPLEKSVILAMLLHSVQYLNDPLKQLTPEDVPIN